MVPGRRAGQIELQTLRERHCRKLLPRVSAGGPGCGALLEGQWQDGPARIAAAKDDQGPIRLASVCLPVVLLVHDGIFTQHCVTRQRGIDKFVMDLADVPACEQ